MNVLFAFFASHATGDKRMQLPTHFVPLSNCYSIITPIWMARMCVECLFRRERMRLTEHDDLYSWASVNSLNFVSIRIQTDDFYSFVFLTNWPVISISHPIASTAPILIVALVAVYSFWAICPIIHIVDRTLPPHKLGSIINFCATTLEELCKKKAVFIAAIWKFIEQSKSTIFSTLTAVDGVFWMTQFHIASCVIRIPCRNRGNII